MNRQEIIINEHNFKIALVKTGMTKKAFCQKAKIYSNTYSRIINGKGLSPQVVGRIVKALDVDVEDLIL